MITENSTYTEILPLMKRVLEKNPYTFSSIKGKIERAVLKGEDRLFLFIQPKGLHYKLFFNLRIKIKTFSVGIVVEGKDGNSYICPGNGLDVIFIIRGHALKRYIQRKIYHDENHEVTEEEMLDALRKVSDYMTNCNINYDMIGQEYHLGFDSGVFICTEDNGLLVMQTYVPISMLKINQSLSYRKSVEQTREFKNSLDDIGMKKRAENDFRKIARKC